MKVFIVEDEAFLVLNLKRQLLAAGYEICGVESTGERAIARLLGADEADLVIMDIGLAGRMSGIDTARALAAEKTLPVIFMTGYDEAEIRERAGDLAPAGFLAKPVGTDKLLACIDAVRRERGIAAEKSIER